MEDTYKYIPDDEEVDLMMEDWLGGQRQNDTFVHKNTVDAMSATVEEIPYSLLHHLTARITSEVKGVNRVLYDLTPKAPATIEYE